MEPKTKESANISIVDVSKEFRLGILKKKTAVSHLTLEVPQGQLVGLLGPNGSGKSTTLKMMLGFLKPTSGEISVCGHSAQDRIARTFMGYLPENPRFQKFLTGHQTLMYFGRLLGYAAKDLKSRVGELLELVNLKNAAEERVHGYSKGMTQRLAIAQALLNRPPILVFDEPMSGLDPVGRIEIRKLIRQIHSHDPQTTIFFSTHILGDVEELCTYVALLRKGELATYCSLDELLSQSEERYEVTLHKPEPELRDRLLKEKKGILSPAGLTLTLEGTNDLIQGLGEIQSQGARIIKISSYRRSLEEALFSESAILPIASTPDSHNPSQEVKP